MSTETIVAVLGVLGGVGGGIVAGWFTRPKVNAEARAADATGQVSISGSALEWTRVFAERADRAEEKAQAAEDRADAAEQKVDELTRKCERTDRKLDDCIGYVLTLQRQIRMTSEQPADPPSSLRPPL